MRLEIKKTGYALREQWNGSGKINLWMIVLLTFIFYIVFSYFNSDILSFIFDVRVSDLKTNEHKIMKLENLKIPELIILVPISVTTILLMFPSLNLKSNSLVRTLPLSIVQRLIAFFITVLTVTAISYFMVYVLNEIITYYLRSKYLNTLISLQENNGDLYKQLERDSILSTTFSNRWHEARAIIIVFTLSLAINTVLFVITLWTQKFAIVKGIIFIIILTIIALYVNDNIYSHFNNQFITINNNNPIILATIPIFPSLLASLYFLLKESEQ